MLSSATSALRNSVETQVLRALRASCDSASVDCRRLISSGASAQLAPASAGSVTAPITADGAAAPADAGSASSQLPEHSHQSEKKHLQHQQHGRRRRYQPNPSHQSHVNCLACGTWHPVPSGPRGPSQHHHQPRSLPLLSRHTGRPCRSIAISLAEEMANESGAVIDRKDMEAARRPFRTLFGRVASSRLAAADSRGALEGLVVRLMQAAAGGGSGGDAAEQQQQQREKQRERAGQQAGQRSAGP